MVKGNVITTLREEKELFPFQMDGQYHRGGGKRWGFTALLSFIASVVCWCHCLSCFLYITIPWELEYFGVIRGMEHYTEVFGENVNWW